MVRETHPMIYSRQLWRRYKHGYASSGDVVLRQVTKTTVAMLVMMMRCDLYYFSLLSLPLLFLFVPRHFLGYTDSCYGYNDFCHSNKLVSFSSDAFVSIKPLFPMGKTITSCAESRLGKDRYKTQWNQARRPTYQPWRTLNESRRIIITRVEIPN